MLVGFAFFQGTPDEFPAVNHLFEKALAAANVPSGAAPDPASANVPLPPEGIENSPGLSVEVVERALTRHPLSENQKAVLRVIAEAGEEGIISSQIAEQVGLTRSQIAGVLGALGRRIANTEGWPKGQFITAFQWDQEAGQWRYWALPEVREVVESGAVTL